MNNFWLCATLTSDMWKLEGFIPQIRSNSSGERAKAMQSASEIVDFALTAFVSSSEDIFL